MNSRPPPTAEPPVPHCAFLTDDPEAIINFATDSAVCAHGSALVTLVEIHGGAARSLGAQMAVRGDGGFCGFISGGCVEAAVAAEAVAAIQTGSDRYLRLGEGSPFIDITLPCGGGITLSIHVVKNASPLRQVLRSLGNRRPAALAYDPRTQSLAIVRSIGHTSGWEGTRFVRSFRPSLRLILCGRGLELETTKTIAAASDFEVFTFESDLKHFASVDIDQDTAIVLLFHDLESEMPVLEKALGNKAFYIGALGSRKTHERRCNSLLRLGFPQWEIDRIKGPIGMYGPTRDAHSLALSILADVSWARQTTMMTERD
jgi:xanthine dehydrogenase accessory factor